MRKIGQILLVSIVCVLFTSCEEKKEANLFKAQNCLDRATAASANSCLTFISGQSSTRSHIIRCSIAFMAEAIDEQAIVSALQNINGNQGGNPTSATLAALGMSSQQVANDAVTTCTLTGSTSLTALANFASISTAVNSVLGLGTEPTTAQIEAALAAYAGGASAQDKETLGNAVIASQQSICNTTDGLLKSDPACTDINQAIANNPGNPTAIADALIANFNNLNN